MEIIADAAAGVTLDQVHIRAEDFSIAGSFKNNPSWGNVSVGGTPYKDLPGVVVDQPDGSTWFVFNTAVDFDSASDGVYVTVHTSVTRAIACPVN